MYRAVGRSEKPGGQVLFQGLLEGKVLLLFFRGKGMHLLPFLPCSDGPVIKDDFSQFSVLNSATVLSVIRWPSQLWHRCLRFSCPHSTLSVLTNFTFCMAVSDYRSRELGHVFLSDLQSKIKTRGRFLQILWPSHNVLTLQQCI